MKQEFWLEVERMLHEASQLTPGERAAFVAAIGDPDVRAEVASLLAADRAESTSSLGGMIGGMIGQAAEAVLDDPLPAGSVMGHFRVIGEIGRGGMGVVYRALDLKLKREVALKLLPASLHTDVERLRRFEREARLAAALNHPNIVTVFEVGEWESRPFIATEFIQGETLAEVLTRGPLSTAEAVRVGRQILAALAVAHQAGIVHRDLKPANVMIRTDRNVKVLDFGLAHLAPTAERRAPEEETATQTVAGLVMGTPGYMAPEQWEGRPADTRSDVYAFGCVLYEMLTGRRVKLERKPVPSRALEKIVGRCLEADPERRWQSAAGLDIELGKAARSRTYWRGIGIAAAGVILVLSAIFTWQQRTHAAPLSDKDVLVLSDFTNATGDAVFEGTLRQALAIQLEQSPFLKIMDDTQMRQDLRLMGRSPADRITSQLAHDICVRDAAAATIEGSIARLGNAYAITLQAVSCKNGATLARAQSQAEDKERVLQAVGTAATTMRGKLGESLASIEKLNGPLEQFTTSSLEALQTYAMGYVPQSQGQFLTAIPFFQRAIEMDPNFAMAYLLTSIGYSNAGDNARSNEYQKKAFALIDRVSEYERLLISARYYWQVTGELDKAIDLDRLLARSYPRYWGAHSELCFIYRSTGQFEKAVEEGRESVRLGPRVEPAYRNLESAFVRLDRFAEAREVLAKARLQHLEGARLHQRLLELAYIEGDQTAAANEIQWYAGKPEEYFSFAAQAANADALGQRGHAGKLYRSAADAAERRGLSGVAGEFKDADALAEALTGNCRATRRVGRPALALALCGDAATAEKLAGETSKIFPGGTLWNAVQLPAIHAAMELRRDHPATAVELLSPAIPYVRAFPEVLYLRGLAYLHRRKGEEAAVEFRKILDHKGANWGLYYGLSYPALARAAALAGNTATASQAYRDFLNLWKNADPDLALMGQARKELAELHHQK